MNNKCFIPKGLRDYCIVQKKIPEIRRSFRKKGEVSGKKRKIFLTKEHFPEQVDVSLRKQKFLLVIRDC